MLPPIIPTESARLCALHELEVLDTPAEARFDEIAELAARFCETPTGMVTLIDGTRQWFKAQFGFSATETARDDAFCAHTIAQREVMEVIDAQRDPRFADNTFVTGEPHIRFYAGMPLVTAEGHAVGSLAVFDYVPRQLRPDQLASLRALANQVVTQLVLGQSLAQIRRTSDQTLARRERRLTALFESALESIIEMNHEGIILDFNPAAERTFGHARAAVVGRSMADVMIPPRLREAHHHGFAAHLATGHARILGRRTEAFAVRADGSEFPIELTVTRLDSEDPPVFVGFIRDLTEPKRLERALHLSIERFELVARATNDVIWDWDLRTDALWWSKSFATHFGYKLEDVTPGIESWFDRIHRDDRVAIEESIHGVIDSAGEYWTGEYRFRRGDGTYAIIHDRGYVARDDRGRPLRIVGLMMDVTERRQLEEQLLQSQKMEAIGQLAGGIAHDFNNLLTIIQCNAFLIEQCAHRDIEELTHDVLAATERAAALTRQLLLVSRKKHVRTASVNMAEVVGGMMKMLERVLGASFRLRCSFDRSLPDICADASMLEQVLLNLVVNARQAMPEGGTLHITTSLTTITAPGRRQDLEVAAGSYACLTVTDTGGGISPENLPQIFKPFFTTKEAGHGTGLGLSTVYNIVKQHHGWLDVSSEPGRGTTFVIALPIPTSPLPERVAPAFRTGELPRGAETILLVEDEPLLRSRVASLLRTSGYVVIEAASGARALEVWTQRSSIIDLVLTDLVMPDGVSGIDLANELRAQRPALPIVFTSGYLPEPGSGEPLVEGVNFLEKPYPPSQLLQLVRQVLDRSS